MRRKAYEYVIAEFHNVSLTSTGNLILHEFGQSTIYFLLFRDAILYPACFFSLYSSYYLGQGALLGG